ncbi:hypothetical protein D3C81_2081450 [compost metagenome]
MTFDQVARQCQSEAGAGLAAGNTAAVIATENLLAFIGCNAGAVVCDIDMPAIAYRFRAQDNRAAGRCVFDCIVE